ncbi:MAG: 3-methyl-2-oxobutanoate dehydrogenase subunit VorB [Clostridiales bacterium]|jgi:2-oxoglutarate ferredoxin oxidoreductase subunit alpha|nr:3-methyl-2-oxobutanoate dehydrogenase subunit VorB [Clostridiales bacterium]
MALTLMKGSEAIAESAIRAGCRYFFGYPITPQTEIPEYMSARMPEVGGTFLQAESEIGAINMVYGAAGTGARVLTSSSSPGVSLKQEGISYIAASEIPCVIINIMRGGPGLGSIQAGQADYFQSTKGGGHGDYRLIVLAPASVQESVDLMSKAFELAEEYRNPVLIAADGMICQMMEPVELPEMQDFKIDYKEKPWAVSGEPESENHKRAIVNSLYITVEELDELNERLQANYRKIEENVVMYETYNLENAEIVLTAFGTVARICKASIDELKEEGINIGLFRPITIWPFPYEELYKVATAPGVKAVLDVELNAGQMLEDVKLAVRGDQKVDFYGRYGSHMPSSEEITEKIRQMRSEL